MIKLTVHPSVEAALQKAFPKPAAAASRALAKYIGVVESMLFDTLQRGQTPEQRKLGLYAISLDQLANKGGQIGPKKIRVHKWLTDNDWDIVQTVVKGTKFSGQYSQVKLTPLVTLENTLQMPAGSLSAATTNEQIDAYLSGDDISNIALFDHLYPEYNLQWREDKLADLFDWVPVDVESVKAYVYWLEMESDLIKGPRKDLALRQSLTILGIAAVTRGYYLQRKKPSPFGRIYYEGTSVQNVNKELRRAMLGNCWEYDIRSSVVAWKMGYARDLLLQADADPDVRLYFPATTLYLEDKVDFMATVRYFTFAGNTVLTKDFQMLLIKQALTAISFGAKSTGNGWTDNSGGWNNPALVEILKNKSERDRFLADPTVNAFIEEQRALDDFIFGLVKTNSPELLALDCLKTASGRVSKSKVLAFLYQHAETKAMDLICSLAAKQGHFPVARVHDAVFFRSRLGPDFKHELEFKLHDATHNKYWHLSPKQLKRYEPVSIDAAHDELLHRQRIADEEKRAIDYFTA